MLGRRFAGPGLREFCDGAGQVVEPYGIRIEIFADPLLRVGMDLVHRVGESVQELGITPRGTDVFRRTASNGIDQDRVCQAGDRVGDALDLDRMLPAVAEVVGDT